MNKEIEELAERSKNDRALIAGSEVRWVCGTALALLEENEVLKAEAKLGNVPYKEAVALQEDNDLLTRKLDQSEKRRMTAEAPNRYECACCGSTLTTELSDGRVMVELCTACRIPELKDIVNAFKKEVGELQRTLKETP